MKRIHKTLISSIIAGICISIGGTCFLSVDNRVIGSFLFSLGLLTICSCGFHLFTGKVCFAKNVSDITDLIIIYIGNLCGCLLTGLAVRIVKPQIIQTAVKICNTKMDESWYAVIILGVLCNILIFFAVKCFRSNVSGSGYIILIVCIMSFILCGFEHCVANMFYFIVSGNNGAIRYIALNTFGNAIGGLAIGRLYDRLQLQQT